MFSTKATKMYKATQQVREFNWGENDLSPEQVRELVKKIGEYNREISKGLGR